MAKKQGRPPKIDEAGREILREIVTEQPYATLDEVTAAFTQRTRLTANAATVRKALRQAGLKRERATVVVKRRSQEEEAAKRRYGYTDEHRRQEQDQRYPSCLTQTEWELVADLFEQPDKRGRPPQYSPLGLGECVLLRGAHRLFLAHVAVRVSTLGECVSHLPALGSSRQVRADA